jgi:glycosyltransferase involved in cell wall biosynthesis
MADLDSVRVSYVIMTKNRARYLERTLGNVREFIEPLDELIIIDGASTDDTHKIVARNSDIVTVFVSEPDEGEAHAFNKALFRSHGRYIKPITDDDYFYPNAMRRLVAEMESRPEIEAILCGGEIWDTRSGQPIFVAHRFLPESVAATKLSIFDYSSIGLGVIIRRTAIEKTGGVSNNFKSVDGDLICRLIECNCELRYLDIDLYRWHIHPHSGFNNEARMTEDLGWFSLRTGRGDQFVFRTPQLARLHANGASPRRVNALYRWLWIAGLAWRSPLWPVSLLIYRPLEVIFFSARTIRRRLFQAPIEQLRTHEWSGKLR